MATAVMTLSSFRAKPRVGHLERAKRIIGYLAKMKNATIRFRAEEPDMSRFEKEVYGCEKTVYEGAKEIVPEDAPEKRGNRVTVITFVDANLMHDIISGKSVTGILHFLNKTRYKVRH